MKWLTLALIKQQCRIPTSDTSQDDLLTLYGESAERFVLNYLQRTEAELKAMNPDDSTKVSSDIVEATLLLVTKSYEHRSPMSPQNLYLIDYGFDALVSNYRKGTYSSIDIESV